MGIKVVKPDIRGLEPDMAQADSGKQVKVAGSGFYKKKKSDGTTQKVYVKASEHFFAHTLNGPFASAFYTQTGVGKAVAYEFVIEKNTKRLFNASEVRSDTTKLSELVPGFRKLSEGWFGCEPSNNQNRQKIHAVFKDNPARMNAMAGILVDCIFHGNKDCQIDNILIGDNDDVLVYDFDWSGEGILKPENQMIQLFGPQDKIAFEGPYKMKFRPARHFVEDYPAVVFSSYMLAKIDEKLKKTKEINEVVDAQLAKIDNLYKIHDPKGLERLKREAFQALANHYGYQGHLGATSTEMKQNLSRAMKAQNVERMKSLELLKPLIRITMLNETLKQKQYKRHVPAEKQKEIGLAIKELVEIVQRNYAGKRVKDFMPKWEPSINNLLGNLLTVAEKCKKRCSRKDMVELNLDANSLTFVQNLRSEKTIVPTLKPQPGVKKRTLSVDSVDLERIRQLKAQSKQQKKAQKLEKRAKSKTLPSNFKAGPVEKEPEYVFIPEPESAGNDDGQYVYVPFEKPVEPKEEASQSKTLQPLTLAQIWEQCDPLYRQAQNLDIPAKTLTPLANSYHVAERRKWAEQGQLTRQSVTGPKALEALEQQVGRFLSHRAKSY